MNRIRKVNSGFQVLITPDIPMSPDASLMVGNWTDEHLRNYYVLTFPTKNDAMAEAYKYPDLDWFKLVLNHEEIFKRLAHTIKKILDANSYNVDFKAQLMTPETMKNIMFDRVLQCGERFNLKSNFNDIICFTIVNPWAKVLQTISKKLETYMENDYLDVLRIKEKKVIDGKIILLYGYTEFGTIYEIKLVPTLMNQWGDWAKKAVCKDSSSSSSSRNIYSNVLKTQAIVDNGTVFI